MTQAGIDDILNEINSGWAVRMKKIIIHDRDLGVAREYVSCSQ